MNKKRDINKWITKSIIDFVNESKENTLDKNLNEKAWGSPLVGFSRGDDKLYSFLKKDIGDFYLTPYEMFSKTYPDIKFKSSELAIICWILPQTKETKSEQYNKKYFPSKRAVLSRVNGDKFNKKIGKFVIELLNKEGFSALSPILSPLWDNKKSKKYGYASTWSERHAAYVSGLGTFGLSDGLITAVGKAMRCGSVIAKLDIKPIDKSYKKYNEYCLYFKNRSCMKCAERCPAKAITEKGHDKIKCREYQRQTTSKYIKNEYNIDSSYCGLCQFKVPCESKIP
ncbi:MAG: epoxyqueuosine reductase [Firmicutes bacterium]|nr:epoxyqueuosine reductase [Bacillota bacterium]